MWLQEEFNSTQLSGTYLGGLWGPAPGVTKGTPKKKNRERERKREKEKEKERKKRKWKEIGDKKTKKNKKTVIFVFDILLWEVWK